jgi:hypothetical protein
MLINQFVHLSCVNQPTRMQRECVLLNDLRIIGSHVAQGTAILRPVIMRLEVLLEGSASSPHSLADIASKRACGTHSGGGSDHFVVY